MSEIRQLSAGSSQVFLFMLRDKNKAPIKADTIHIKGIVYTKNKDNGFAFEANKSVCTNCTVHNGLLLISIDPLLLPGRVYIYTQTFINESDTAIGGVTLENTQQLNIEIVKTGTFLSDRQGAMWDDIYLPIETNNSTSHPWAPSVNDLKQIDDFLKNYVTSQDFIDLINKLGTFTEIPGSRITDTIEAKRVVPKVFFSQAFNFIANKGDSFRVFMKSDKNDGFYLQSGTDGIPLFSLGMEVSELAEVTKLSEVSGIKLMDGDKEVNSDNYTIQIDIKTGTIRVIEIK